MLGLKRRSNTWIFLLIGVFLIRVLIFWPQFIERYYSHGVYPILGRILRTITGCLPFSLGDVLYSFSILLIFNEFFKWLAFSRINDKKAFIKEKLSFYISTLLSIYLVFNFLWGLNYNRSSIQDSFGLEQQKINDSLLLPLTERLRDRTNALYTAKTAELDYSAVAAKGYLNLSQKFPFLDPARLSVKPSIFGSIGNYLGYSGYFNPFTGEGQVNPSLPKFIIPFVASHEMAHQMGYAKENEASFVGHLAAKASGDTLLQYSSYLHLFLSAHRELRMTDSTAAKKLWQGLKPEVLNDIKTYSDHLKKFDTPVGVWVDTFYNQYLKLNEQPNGMRTYNLVTIWLMAWMIKYGEV